MGTTIARIVEKFTMQLPDAPERDAWFLDYVLRSPASAGKHLTAGWLAMQSLAEVGVNEEVIDSCVEYFGGMGAQAAMVSYTFNPEVFHQVNEWNLDAVAHLEALRDDGAEWIGITPAHRDAYSPSSFRPADLVVLDFGDLTVWKTREGEKHRKLLDRVFTGKPKAVLLTDIACRYLHLHRERYETLLGPGTCGNYDDYLVALSKRIERVWGYTLVRGYMDRWSTVMALVPSGEHPRLPREFIETPSSPVGLELL